MLRPDRQVYISRNLEWALDQTTIINFFDHILKSAINLRRQQHLLKKEIELLQRKISEVHRASFCMRRRRGRR